MKSITISPDSIISCEDVYSVAKNNTTINISPHTLTNVKDAYKKILTLSKKQKVYGLTSGVADLTTEKRDAKDYSAQDNLLLSHSAGVGDYLEKEVVRAMIFVRLVALSKGYSAVRPELLVFLTELLNKDIVPLVSSLGSVGLSDLTVLAETFLPILNESQVLYKGEIMKSADAFRIAKIEPLNHLASREGLALINNNSGTIARAALLFVEIESFVKKNVLVAALSMEGRKSTFAAYNSVNQIAKPFIGQTVIAKFLEKLLAQSSQITTTYNNDELKFLQDPISFKTIAQSIGNAWDSLQQAQLVITTEINSITDNPLLPPDQAAPVSSGNYYCGQLTLVIDQLTLVLSQICSASSARVEILLNDNYSEGLPKYLIEAFGVNSGFMITGYSIRAVMVQIQALCYPRSVLSSKTANGWEDISTNAYNAALNLKNVIALANEILTIELLIATQANALRMKKDAKITLGKGTGKLFASVKNELSKNNYTLPFEKDFYIAKVLRILKKFHMQKDFVSEFASFFPSNMATDVIKQFKENKKKVEAYNN